MGTVPNLVTRRSLVKLAGLPSLFERAILRYTEPTKFSVDAAVTRVNWFKTSPVSVCHLRIVIEDVSRDITLQHIAIVSMRIEEGMRKYLSPYTFFLSVAALPSIPGSSGFELVVTLDSKTLDDHTLTLPLVDLAELLGEQLFNSFVSDVLKGLGARNAPAGY